MSIKQMVRHLGAPVYYNKGPPPPPIHTQITFCFFSVLFLCTKNTAGETSSN